MYKSLFVPVIMQLFLNSKPNFLSLLDDTDAGTVQVTSLFASWLLLAFANSSLKGSFQIEVASRDVLFPLSVPMTLLYHSCR